MTTTSNSQNSAPQISWEDLGFREITLSKNLAALERQRPDLFELLREATVHDLLTVRTDDDGAFRVHLRHRRALIRIEERHDELRLSSTTLSGCQDACDVLLVGSGTGERAAFMLTTMAQDEHLWVFERDPALLTLTLARRDWSHHILSGRIRFLFGSDLRQHQLPEFRMAVLHPLMGGVLASEWDYVRNSFDSHREGSFASEYSDRPRVAVIAGELLHHELVRALEDSGVDASIIDPTSLSRDQLTHELTRLEPAAVFSINFLPDLAGITGALGTIYVAWEIDPSASAIESIDPLHPAASHTWIFTWRRVRVDAYRAANYRHVEYLPLAADPRRRTPDPCELGLRQSPVFVGSCMRKQGRVLLETLGHGIADDRSRARSWSAALLELQRLDRLVRADPCRNDVECLIAEMLADYGLPSVLDIDGKLADVCMLLGESLAATKRVALVSSLLDDGLTIFGEDAWRDEIPAARYRGPVGNGIALNRVYSSAAINVDINRAYQPEIATLRVFDALACQGFVLAERAADIEALFRVGRDLDTFSSIKEAKEKTRFYLAHPEIRAEMASTGRDRVLREHSVLMRVQTMLQSACADVPQTCLVV